MTNSTTFVDYLTPVTAAWTNDVDAELYDYQYNVMHYAEGLAINNGTLAASTAIQAAINAANTAGGGVVYLPEGTYNLGTTGLTIYQNITLKGATQQYTGANTRGTILAYSGTGFGITGQNLLNVVLEDFSMNNSGATGSAHIGIFLQGAWLSTIRRVRISGSTPAKGYSIRIDTFDGGPTWGGQHNLLEMVESADGILHFLGIGAGNGVTTTVCNTVRGFRYEVVSSQVVFINSTAEEWGAAGAGFDFTGVGCKGLLLGCDIENTEATTVGIAIDADSEVRELGTIWDGFSGTIRVSGTMGTLRSYGGALEWIKAIANDTAVVISKHGNASVGAYISELLYPVDTTTHEGYRMWKRYIAGTERTTHEFRYHAIRHHSKTVANSAVTIVTLAIPSGGGVSVHCTAWGTETGVSVFAHSCDITAANNAGTVTTPVVSNVSESPAGSGAVFTAAAATTNVEIKFAHASVTGTTIKFLFVVHGEFTNITLG